MPVKTLMLATGNAGKLAEIRALLAAQSGLENLSLLTPRDWPRPLPTVEETGATFAENAGLKAQALAEATRLPTLADDSGLCVDALGGDPGIYSARWAGEAATDSDRNHWLLTALADVVPAQRTARFVCVVCLALPDGTTVTTEGVCEGLILDAPCGTGGFGYDPLFFLPLLGRTVAELTPEEKNVWSHRAQAIVKIAPDLRKRVN